MVLPLRPGVQVLASAAAVMALEVCGPRLLAPAFGSGTIVWSAVLAATLVAIGGGNLAGGRLADRGGRPGAGGLLLAGAAACAAAAWAARPVAGALSEGLPATPAGQLAALLMASALLFGPPSALLSAVYPLAFREALAGLDTAGRTAGALYAASAVGSLVGALAPPLWSVPALGARGSLWLFAAVPALAALGAGGPVRAAALVLALLLAAGAARGEALPGAALERWESSLASYRLDRDGPNLVLREEVPADVVLSVAGPDAMRRSLAYAPLVLARHLATPEPPQRVLILGLGGGTAALMAREAFPEAEIQAVELDPTLVDRARRHFGLDLAEVTVHVGDGRALLRRLPAPWDLVMVDVSLGSTPPPHMASREFVAEVRRRLSPTGVVAAHAPPPLNLELYNAIKAEFTHSLILDRAAVGSAFPLDARGFEEAADRLGWTASEGSWTRRLHRPPAGEPVTDDRGGPPWWWGMRVDG